MPGTDVAGTAASVHLPRLVTSPAPRQAPRTRDTPPRLTAGPSARRTASLTHVLSSPYGRSARTSRLCRAASLAVWRSAASSAVDWPVATSASRQRWS